MRAFLRFHRPHHLWAHKPKDVSDSRHEAVDVSKLSTTPIKQVNDIHPYKDFLTEIYKGVARSKNSRL